RAPRRSARAAPALDAREASELHRDPRCPYDTARRSRPNEHPLVGGRPRHEEPPSVRGADGLLEAARPTEHDLAAVEHLALAAPAADDGRVGNRGSAPGDCVVAG